MYNVDDELIFNRINDNKDERTVEPLKSKRIGSNYRDYCVAVSNPCYGNLRIIATENNKGDNCQIVVCLHMSD